MTRAAVLGHPIDHSLSPALHNAAYAALGLLDWHYAAIDCTEDGLAALLAASSGWAGFSCTMPLKRVALAVADEADPLAVVVGAANTLLPMARGRWRAAMTDVAGIVDALATTDRARGSVTILGAGGTAQAALGALAQLGYTEAAVLVRDLSRTGELRACADRLGFALRQGELSREAGDLRADLVISTLPAHAADVVADRAWLEGQTVLDAVYDPWPTALGQAAKDGGASVISGALMLLHQAAAQVRLMTGQQPPIEAMRAALLAAAPGCGA